MLNEHLRQLMDGLTAKVFRTYNASITLQEQLAKLTNRKSFDCSLRRVPQTMHICSADENVHHKMLSYNRANRRVAELCNHQRAVPKTFEKTMENLQNKARDHELP